MSQVRSPVTSGVIPGRCAAREQAIPAPDTLEPGLTPGAWTHLRATVDLLGRRAGAVQADIPLASSCAQCGDPDDDGAALVDGSY
jgi:hypothetical protein